MCRNLRWPRSRRRLLKLRLREPRHSRCRSSHGVLRFRRKKLGDRGLRTWCLPLRRSTEWRRHRRRCRGRIGRRGRAKQGWRGLGRRCASRGSRAERRRHRSECTAWTGRAEQGWWGLRRRRASRAACPEWRRHRLRCTSGSRCAKGRQWRWSGWRTESWRSSKWRRRCLPVGRRKGRALIRRRLRLLRNRSAPIPLRQRAERTWRRRLGGLDGEWRRILCSRAGRRRRLKAR